ncbi:hypothetical protein [Helicobacter pylori]|uniref:hypothetical protein n=1 Tax=Helicobacter pylori TaxID=210 RepID=UPI000269F3F6|nr:hypothetical protein [Helicobacter pylori]EJB60491.1 putative Hac prophage II domain protein [Helicobacter pylori Hp H-41]
MRQEHETAKSFNKLKEITQIMQAQKARAKKSENANENDSAHKLALKPKASVKAKKGALNPTKKAFSMRQKTAFRDNSQARANLSRGTESSHNENAFKTEQGLNSNLREKPSEQAFKQGLANNPSNQKGGE